MRLVIQTLRFKNICSFGNNWTSLDFKNGSIGLIIGRNGSGKSTFYEALFFGLYGKPFRKINKDGLVNTTNGKNCLVEIELLADELPVKIVRGIKPNLFEIYVNGTLKNQEASSWDYQSWFETTVLRMDERTFRQLVVLGSTSFIPFMMLKTWERRQVIEDILCLGVYSQMLEVTKKLLAKENLKRSDAISAISYQQVELKGAQSHLSGLSAIIQTSSEALIEQLREHEHQKEKVVQSIENETAKIVNLDICDIQSKFSSLEEQVKRCERIKAGISSAIKKINLDIEFLRSNDHCPTCHQSIDEDFKSKFLNDSTSAVKEKTDGLERLEKVRDQFESDFTQTKAMIDRFNESKRTLSSLKHNLAAIELACSKLKDKISSIKVDNTDAITALKEQIESIKSKISKFESSLEVIDLAISDLNDLDSFLRDSGVKSRIISEHVPLINFMLKKYLDILDFPIQMSFNEDFSECIRSRIREEFSYGNLSAGERMRIDLALLFTWREITRLSNSASCNLLILDEIGDSSLDADGFDSFMKILSTDRDQQSVIVISHKPNTISNLVDFVLEISKPNEFSRIESHVVNDHQEILV